MRRRAFLSLSAGLLPLWACRHVPCSEARHALPEAAPSTSTSSAPVANARSFPELTGYCNATPPCDAAEFVERRSAVQRELGRRQLAGIVIEPGASMKYLFGVRWGLSERPFLVFVPEKGEPTWVAPAFEQRTARERLSEPSRLALWHEHESAYDVLVQSLQSQVLSEKDRIAVDAGTRGFVIEGIQRAFGAARVRIDDPVAACRLIKSPAELACLRRANEATKAALCAAANHLRPGMREREFAEIVTQAQAAAGLEDIWALVLFGGNASFPHGTRSEKPLASGDAVLVDTGGSLHGYASDVTRTWALGAPGPELRRAWATVRNAQDAALSQLFSGRRCAEAEAAARRVITEDGWGAGYEFFTHRLGHGIGLEMHEPPYLVRGNDTVLAPGMVMSNEPGIYVAGKFGVRIEDVVTITSGEPDVFGPRAISLAQPFG